MTTRTDTKNISKSIRASYFLQALIYLLLHPGFTGSIITDTYFIKNCILFSYSSDCFIQKVAFSFWKLLQKESFIITYIFNHRSCTGLKQLKQLQVPNGYINCIIMKNFAGLVNDIASSPPQNRIPSLNLVCCFMVRYTFSSVFSLKREFQCQLPHVDSLNCKRVKNIFGITERGVLLVRHCRTAQLSTCIEQNQ